MGWVFFAGLAIASGLLLWLTGLPGTTVERHRSPPHGHWILLGFGSFSQGLAATIASEGMPVTVIDLQPPAASSAQVRWVQGDGTGAEALLKAGVAQAAGIVAATSSDVDNLSATFTARELNPGLFTIVRQNNMGNRPLFERFAADLTMVPSEVIAHECLAILTTPMLAPFLQRWRDQGYEVIVTADHGQDERGHHGGTGELQQDAAFYYFGDSDMPAKDVVLDQLALAPSILTRLGVPVPATMKAKPFFTA